MVGNYRNSGAMNWETGPKRYRSKGTKRCPDCGTKLSVYNRSRYCYLHKEQHLAENVARLLGR